MQAARTSQSFYETIAAAVRDFADKGYDSEARLEEWTERIRAAAQAEMVPEAVMEAELRRTFESVYSRLVDRGELLRYSPGVGRFALQRVQPQLREELSRRIMASANLIKLNRAQAVEETLQRFAGWATSIPPGGSDQVRRREVQARTRSEFAQLGFRERRVNIDQAHKFTSNLSQILASASGAIAATWRQHYTRFPRHSHRQRDGKIYLVRNSWAHERGLVKPGPAGYTDEVTQPGEEVYCRCTFTWHYALRDLPSEMITRRGRDEMERVRRELAA